MPDTAEPLVRTIDIEATPATVFSFFVDADKLTRWLATEATLDPRPGGECLQRHDPDEPGQGPFHMQGTFVEVDPPYRVAFTWGFTEPEVNVPPGSTVVEVTLAPLDSGSATRVTLVHRDLPVAEVESHAGGWTEMLARLARAVKEEP